MDQTSTPNRIKYALMYKHAMEMAVFELISLRDRADAYPPSDQIQMLRRIGHALKEVEKAIVFFTNVKTNAPTQT